MVDSQTIALLVVSEVLTEDLETLIDQEVINHLETVKEENSNLEMNHLTLKMHLMLVKIQNPEVSTEKADLRIEVSIEIEDLEILTEDQETLTEDQEASIEGQEAMIEDLETLTEDLETPIDQEVSIDQETMKAVIKEERRRDSLTKMVMFSSNMNSSRRDKI
jgi:hypothetical protein